MRPIRKRATPKMPHWYRIYVGECPLCGHDAGYRERVFGRRPAKREARYVYLSDMETYNRCEP